MAGEDLETYKQAVWEFLLEHCDIERSGKLFIKFHTDHRGDFERRIRARWKYKYHREDVVAKELRHETKVVEYLEGKKAKHDAWVEGNKRRRRWAWLRHIGITIR